MITGKNKAFLLIEVLVAVLIVASSIVFINHAFTSSFKAASLSSDYLSAALFLEDKSFDFELNPEIEEGELSGQAEFAGGDFSWTQAVSSLDEEELGDEYGEEDIGLKKLSLTVKWQRHNAEREIGILTYIQTRESEE